MGIEQQQWQSYWKYLLKESYYSVDFIQLWTNDIIAKSNDDTKSCIFKKNTT